MDCELSVIQKSYELYKHFTKINTASSMPKIHRYGIGTKTLNLTLDLLDELIAAKLATKSQKAVFLLQASSKIEMIRLHLRLYLDLKLANETKIFQMQALLRNISRETGGWLKSTR